MPETGTGEQQRVVSEASHYWSSCLRPRDPHWQRIYSGHPLMESGRASLLAWEEELAAIRHVLSIAANRRNNFISCSALPNEVLGRIFELLAFLQPIPVSRARGARSLGWAVVTSVCKRWRNVALSHASLWSILITDVGQPWNIFLERAAGSALSIKGSLSGHPSDRPSMQLIENNFHRIRRLILKILSGTPLFDIVTAAPDLEILDLTSSNIHFKEQLRPEFFSSIAPNLREVKLDRTNFSWSSAAVNIRSLELCNIELPIPDALRCFSRMPLLEALNVSGGSTLKLSALAQASVSFPNLRKLTIATNSPDDNMRLWQYIIPDPCSYITIRDGSVGGLAKLELISSLLCRPMSMPNCPTFTSLDFVVDHHASEAVTLHLSNDASFGVMLGLQKVFLSMAAVAQSLCTPIAANITRLRLAGVNFSDWNSLLASAKSLNTLHVESQDTQSVATLCSALMPASADLRRSENGEPMKKRAHTEDNHPLVFLASLAHLLLDQIDLYSQSPSDPSRSLGEVLLASLEARMVNGCQLAALTVNNRSIDKAVIAVLDEFVAHLIWDGNYGRNGCDCCDCMFEDHGDCDDPTCDCC